LFFQCLREFKHFRRQLGGFVVGTVQNIQSSTPWGAFL
jgi:hypothetical protein